MESSGSNVYQRYGLLAMCFRCSWGAIVFPYSPATQGTTLGPGRVTVTTDTSGGFHCQTWPPKELVWSLWIVEVIIFHAILPYRSIYRIINLNNLDVGVVVSTFLDYTQNSDRRLNVINALCYITFCITINRSNVNQNTISDRSHVISMT